MPTNFRETRQYRIYEWYILSFKEKPKYIPNSKCMFKYILDGFITGLSIGLYWKTKQKYCPWCCTPVDNISYHESPIFTYGCNHCRTKLSDYSTCNTDESKLKKYKRWLSTQERTNAT